MPKVSVIIPVYNVEKYLRQCLDSVVNQTLKDIEIICVNDGSPDNSLAILEEYAQNDNRIKIINKSNGGISSARNAGLKIAQGEFIGFVDSDDYIALNYYESLYNRAKVTCSDIVVAEYIYRFNNKKKKIFLKVDKNIVTTSVKEKFECLYLPDFCYVCNKIYKRDFLKVMFIEGVTYEDIYFASNVLAQAGRMAVAENIAYFYRNNADSIVNDTSSLNNYFYHRAMAYFYQFLHEQNIEINTKDYHKTQKYKFLGITFLKIKKIYFKYRYSLLGIFKWSCLKFSNQKEMQNAKS